MHGVELGEYLRVELETDGADVSSRYLTRLVPGMGTTSSPRASSHGRASWFGVRKLRLSCLPSGLRTEHHSESHRFSCVDGQPTWHMLPNRMCHPCAIDSGTISQSFPEISSDLGFSRADDGIRTRDPNLGKVVLYQLSHVREGVATIALWAPAPVAPTIGSCPRSSASRPAKCRPTGPRLRHVAPLLAHLIERGFSGIGVGGQLSLNLGNLLDPRPVRARGAGVETLIDIGDVARRSATTKPGDHAGGVPKRLAQLGRRRASPIGALL